MDNAFLVPLIIGIAVILLYFLYRKNFKILKAPSVCLITGGVKTGKSLLSVYLSIKDFKKRHRRWWIATHIFHKKIEEPMYYTNVSLSFKNLLKNKKHKLDRCIKAITLEHLIRDLRFNYKSVIYIQESSLMSDNMDFKNQERNVELSLFNKLIAHETRGGALYYDTQSSLDNHYSQKRVCSTYFFIMKNLNLLLFHVLYVREMINTENGVNNFEDDVELTMRKVLIPFWYHHKYDRYEFSYLTDDLDNTCQDVPFKQGLVSFNPLYRARGIKKKKDVEKRKDDE